MRQVHADPHHRRARAAIVGLRADRRLAGRSSSSARATPRDGVPELCALPAHESVRKHRAAARHVAPAALRAAAVAAPFLAAPAPRDDGDRPRSPRGGDPAADRRPARAAPLATVGRATAARRAGTRDGTATGCVPDGRATLQPRRQAARAHEDRARGAARAARRDVHLRDARPGRGDDDVRPRRDDGKRQHPAARAPERLVRARPTSRLRSSSVRRRSTCCRRRRARRKRSSSSASSCRSACGDPRAPH